MAVGAINFSVSIFMSHTVSVGVGGNTIAIQSSVAVGYFWCIDVVLSNWDIAFVVALRGWWYAFNIAKQAIMRVRNRALDSRIFYDEKENKKKIY